MDYDDDEIEDTEQSIEESESNKSNEESEEITYKKRGPKKRIVKKNPKTSLQLNDSDVDSETDFFEMEKTVIVQKNKKNKNNNNKNTLNTPWIEKYRPVTIEDLVLDEGMFNKIAKILDDKDMPNMIITGVPGVGKTTTISCIAKNLLGKFYGEAVLELNASDDRGIKTVQESIEHFCKKKIYFDDTIAQHKIVILDEADNMTIKAQQSIKNLMKN